MPDNVQTYLSLAGRAYQKRSFDEVEHYLLKALDLDPGNVDVLQNLGALCDQSGDFEKAAVYYRRALNSDPARDDVRRGLASLCFERGDHDESRELYRSLIERNPDDVDALFAYSRLASFRREDPVFDVLETATANIHGLPFEQQVKLRFVLGKAQQDIGGFEAAFDAFSIANSMHYDRYPFDEAAHRALLLDLKSCLDQRYFAENLTSDPGENVPIFVLGMPRSGSTLVEQILASHSDISSGGELKYLKAAIQQHLVGNRKTIGNAVSGWTRRDLARAAAAYMKNLEQHAAGRRCVVDKMPGNFAFVGIIALLFPGAKIIHTTRHPMATYWSNFCTHFSDALYFSYDPDVLCRYMQGYRDIMEHWQAVLPENTVFNVAYEDLVRHPEVEIRGLLGHLGLPWNDACLQFHQTRRTVKTASIAQVRRPLYSTAIDLWENYAEPLEPWTKRLVPT